MNESGSTMSAFILHDVDWDDAKIARYWDQLSRVPRALSNCWSGQVGKALLRYVSRRSPLRGHVLDYGCGPGFLIADLLAIADEASVYGVEYSEDSVMLVNDKFRGHMRFGGVVSAKSIPTGYEAGYFDLVFFVETIEHIRPAIRSEILLELRRLLRPGGSLIVTTPNEEDMDASRAICPDCGAVFHVVQHMSSWTSRALQSVMEQSGFRTVSCAATHLRVKNAFIGSVKDRLLRRHPPHLVYIGTRPA